MVTPELRAYISNELARGVAADDLRRHLRESGWEANDIEEAFRSSGPSTPAPAPSSSPSGDQKVALYNPSHYTTAGFFFGLVPVFMMSLANGKHLSNGEKLRSMIKKCIALVVAVYVINYSLIAWAFYTIKQALIRGAGSSLALGSDLLLGNTAGVNEWLANDSTAMFAKTVVERAGWITFILSLILLIFTTRYTNKYELPEYKQLKDAGRVTGRSMAVPVLLGLVVSAILLMGIPQLLSTLF